MSDIFGIAKRLARELRMRQTVAESLLWAELRNRNFHGKKFVRQHAIFFEYQTGKTFFIADFYCHEEHLVIEIDGPIHNLQQEYDDFRTHLLNGLGLRVVRFRNEEVENNLNEVLNRLESYCQT